MFNSSTPNRIKNDKLLRWRLELSNYCYDIQALVPSTPQRMRYLAYALPHVQYH